MCKLCRNSFSMATEQLRFFCNLFTPDQQISKHKYLGQRAFQLNVIDYLSQGLEHDPLNANQVVSAISHGVVYSLLSILVTAFDPSRYYFK